MSNRSKGSQSEHSVKRLLEGFGLTVTLSRQSAFPDIIAYDEYDRLLFVEVKTHEIARPPERERMAHLRVPRMARKLLAVVHPAEQAIEFYHYQAPHWRLISIIDAVRLPKQTDVVKDTPCSEESTDAESPLLRQYYSPKNNPES